MSRRTFLAGVAAASASVGLRFAAAETDAAAAPTKLSVGATSRALVADDFVGLSYESAQLANPAFFSAENKGLIALVRELAPVGNLRIGGGSSEFTTYSEEPPSGPPPFEVFGPDTSKTVKHGTVTSAVALRNLRAFLDSTNWSCLYGLNLGQGTVENAVREATAAQRIMGPRLLAFQIGNEPDSFRRRYRPETYGPADYMAEWNRFHDAIAAAVPGARFAGPDISNKLPYLTAFAEEAPKHKDVILLTGHYYAMGPAGNAAATIDNLLAPDPKLTTLKRRDLHVIEEAREAAHLPYRVSEANSCWNGGQPGVSDTFASALWCADYMMSCMSRGWVGVNMHGGGNGIYAPIAGAPSTGFTRRPEYFGMRFAAQFAGARYVETTLTGADPRVDAFVFERDRARELVVVNKTAQRVSCQLPEGLTGAPRQVLSAPAIDAKSGVELKPQHGRHRSTVESLPYSATRYELKGADRADGRNTNR